MKSAGSFIVALALGAGIGAALALLFAPKKGEDVRQDIRHEAEHVVSDGRYNVEKAVRDLERNVEDLRRDMEHRLSRLRA